MLSIILMRSTLSLTKVRLALLASFAMDSTMRSGSVPTTFQQPCWTILLAVSGVSSSTVRDRHSPPGANVSVSRVAEQAAVAARHGMVPRKVLGSASGLALMTFSDAAAAALSLL